MLSRLIGRLATGKVGRAIGLRLLGDFIRGAAEGKQGDFLAAVYQGLASHKRVIGLLLMVGSIATAGIGEQAAAEALVAAGAFMVSVGLIDAAWRSDVPEWLSASAAWRLLAQHSADVAALMGLLYYRLQACGGAFEFAWDNCVLWSRVVLGTAAVLVQFGLMDAAWRTAPPDLTGTGEGK